MQGVLKKKRLPTRGASTHTKLFHVEHSGIDAFTGALVHLVGSVDVGRRIIGVNRPGDCKPKRFCDGGKNGPVDRDLFAVHVGVLVERNVARPFLIGAGKNLIRSPYNGGSGLNATGDVETLHAPAFQRVNNALVGDCNVFVGIDISLEVHVTLAAAINMRPFGCLGREEIAFGHRTKKRFE